MVYITSDTNSSQNSLCDRDVRCLIYFTSSSINNLSLIGSSNVSSYISQLPYGRL